MRTGRKSTLTTRRERIESATSIARYSRAVVDDGQALDLLAL